MVAVVEAPSGETPSSAPPPPEGPEQGVIEEARRRARRRRVRSLLGCIVVAAIVGVTLTHAGAGNPARGRGLAAARPPAAVPASRASLPAVLSQPPYIGVACHVPNLVNCDRVGLAVWLRRPAVSVDATIAGRPLALDDPTWSGPARDGHRTLFAGFLQPAGLARLGVRADATGRWYGAGAPSPAVRLSIDYGRGRHATTDLSVLVTAGWG
jgi:hypothetical protein